MRVGEVPLQLWVVVGLLALLPFAAIGAVLALRRSAAPPRLTKVVLLFGGLGAFGMTCLGFSRMTTPIEPHESYSNPWAELVLPLLLFAYVGFGLGAALGALLVTPSWITRRRLASKGERRDRSTEDGAGGHTEG